VPRLRDAPGWTISLFGVALVTLAAIHHGMELRQAVPTAGPLVALALDGFPGVTLAYAGYWLQGSRFSTDNQWRAVGWCVLGAATFASVTTASIAVRAFEGGQIVEPLFPILLSTGVGGQAGFVAGYFYALAREDAERAERANDALSFVNSVLRHDLRNALNVVQGNASLVESSVDDPDTRERMATIQDQTDEALDRIESAGEMVDTLVGDSDLREVDLAAVATQCGNRVADVHDVSVETDVPDAAPVVADDGLHSVVHNLVENAAEHNDADDPEVAVHVERNGEVARLEVRDNGSGFDDSAVDDGLDEIAGGGGLHLVDALVDHYGGDARVADDDWPGATVVVELPKAAA
jgi:two-component system OmpR family sensor kinase